MAFFDHTHNLPLQLAVELGLPLASVVLGLLAWGLWRGLAVARAASGSAGVMQRAAWMMVLLMVLHSQLEYPLWYAYFLLPTAFAWGLSSGVAPAGASGVSGATAVAPAAPDDPPRASSAAPGLPWMLWVGAALALSAMLAVQDYQRVAAVFSAYRGRQPLVRAHGHGRAQPLVCPPRALRRKRPWRRVRPRRWARSPWPRTFCSIHA